MSARGGKGGGATHPRSAARCPELLEDGLVAQCVHRMPEARVSIGGELAAMRELLHRSALPYRLIAFDRVDHRGIEHEEAAVDPRALGLIVALRLFTEALDPVLPLGQRE